MRIATGVLPWVHGHQFQQLVHTGLHTLSIPAQQLGNCGDVVRDGSVRKQANLLHGIAHAATQALYVKAVDLFAVKKDLASIMASHAVDHFKNRRFARP